MSYIKLTSFEDGSVSDMDIYANIKWIRTIERSVLHGEEVGTRVVFTDFGSKGNPIWVAETPHQIVGMIEKVE
tara:strand:+ start:137 stop:355 length:219 start_codon:yes stop_codon:yes gene_type:complete